MRKTLLALSLALMGALSVIAQPGPANLPKYMGKRSSDPATCAVSNYYYNTTSNVWKLCTATNTWSSVDTASNTLTLTNKTVTNPAVTTQTLTDQATITWDTNSGNIASVTLGGSRTMAAPTNLKIGGSYILSVIQDGTGSRTITWNSVFKWPAGAAPTLTTTAAAKDLITCVSIDGTNLQCNALLDVK